MSRLETDCSLDLHEAQRLLDLIFNVFENADNADDWFAMRGPVGSGILAVQQLIGTAERKVDRPSGHMGVH